MFCEKCGAKVEDGDIFCISCGNRLVPEIKEEVETKPVEQELFVNENGDSFEEVNQNLSQKLEQGIREQELQDYATEMFRNSDLSNGQSNVDSNWMNQGSQGMNQGQMNQGSQGMNQGQMNQGNPWVDQGQGKNPYQNDQTIEKSKKKKSPLKWIIAVLTVFILAGAGVYFYLQNNSGTIDLNKYVVVSFEGYDSVGKAHYEFDTEAFEQDYGKKLKFDYKHKKYSNLGTPVEIIERSVYGELDKDRELSNGDTIKFTWWREAKEYNNIFNYKITYKDASYTVKGLLEVGKFDPFEHLSVEFSGVSPYGEVRYNIENPTEIEESLYFECDKSDGLKNGDTITLTVSTFYGDFDKDFINMFGMLPSCTEKTYTIEGLDTYVEKLSDIPQSKLEEIRELGKDIVLNQNQLYSSYAEITDVSVDDMYLFKTKNENSYNDDILYLVYKIDVAFNYDEFDYKENLTFYSYVSYSNILLKSDGSCEIDTDAYNYNYQSFDYKVEYGEEIWEYDNYWLAGYESKESLFNDLSADLSSDYEYVEN